MNNLTDTHAHLYAAEFDADRNEMVRRSMAENVTRMILPNIDCDSIKGMRQLMTEFPDNCFGMMGLHPGSVNENYAEHLILIKEELYSNNSYVAVGEIGIDLYWDKTYQKQQEESFITQCQWALDLKLPIAIHTRSAHHETIACLKQLPTQPGGVFHCFGGTLKEALEILAMGYYLGIGGVVTYKNSSLPEVLKQIDLKHIVLETDAPYLPPVPFRGKRNESSYLPIIASKLADIYNLPLHTIADVTSANASRLFNLNSKSSFTQNFNS